MSLPPERISIKRRRQDEPVDALFLEHGSSTPDKKRRITDFFFQRLRNNKPVEITNLTEALPKPEDDAVLRQRQSLGIPLVRATTPGDEITDYVKPRTNHDSTNQTKSTRSTVGEKLDQLSGGSLLHKIKSARRFHLTRDLSAALRPNSSGGIRRRKIDLRPPLATFIERQTADEERKSIAGSSRAPVDSIVHFSEHDNQTTSNSSENLLDRKDITKIAITPFHKPEQTASRQGRSIRDDPSTWDFESDQLADELAALALQLDPEASDIPAAPQVDTTPPLHSESSAPVEEGSKEVTMVDYINNSEDDYVFETYVRVQRDENADLASTYFGGDIGVLVINEEDSDLWNKYMHEDDEDDWDEDDEDSNAEENPRNDYPEDEVSSDEEGFVHAHRYHHHYDEDEEDNKRW